MPTNPQVDPPVEDELDRLITAYNGGRHDKDRPKGDARKQLKSSLVALITSLSNARAVEELKWAIDRSSESKEDWIKYFRHRLTELKGERR